MKNEMKWARICNLVKLNLFPFDVGADEAPISVHFHLLYFCEEIRFYQRTKTFALGGEKTKKDSMACI